MEAKGYGFEPMILSIIPLLTNRGVAGRRAAGRSWSDEVGGEANCKANRPGSKAGWTLWEVRLDAKLQACHDVYLLLYNNITGYFMYWWSGLWNLKKSSFSELLGTWSLYKLWIMSTDPLEKQLPCNYEYVNSL